MGIRRGASGKGSQHAGDGFLHPAVGRIAANLRVGVELEGKEEVGRMRTVRGPKGLSGTLSPCGAAQHTQKPAPDFPAGALGAVCLKAPEKRPEKDGSRIMGDGPPCLDGLGIADFPGFRNVRASGGKFRHAFSGVRQGGKAVHAALFHCDIIRTQIPFLIGPNADTPDFGQQDGFPVQWPPVPEYMKIRHLFPVHDHIPLTGQRPPKTPKKGTVRPLEKEMGFHRPILRRKPRAAEASRAQTRPRICPSGWSRRRQASSARQKFSVCQS